jgi:hypothetical protein
VACGSSTATPGEKQHSPLDRLTKENKKKSLNNEQAIEKMDTLQRRQGTQSTGEWGRGTSHTNCK